MAESKERREHDAEKKLTVALAAIKGEKTMKQIGEQFDIHESMVASWKKILLTKGHMVFESNIQNGLDSAEDVENRIEQIEIDAERKIKTAEVQADKMVEQIRHTQKVRENDLYAHIGRQSIKIDAFRHLRGENEHG